METTDFFNEVLSLYSNINFTDQFSEISKIDKYIAYYYADDNDQYISSRTDSYNCVVELDIKSAFPTICRSLFPPDSHFIKNMDTYGDNKKGRLIYIATTLKEAGDYLQRLNTISKMVVLGLAFELSINPSELLILEVKKDGILFNCSVESYENIKNHINDIESDSDIILEKKYPFSYFLNEKNFRFHLTKFNTYYRCNKTSVFLKDNLEDLSIKGKYKYLPDDMDDFILNILTGQDYNQELLKKYYSEEYFNICQHNGLMDLLEKYYICSNNCVLDENGNYQKYTRTNSIYPLIYLKTFIYPALLAIKL